MNRYDHSFSFDDGNKVVQILIKFIHLLDNVSYRITTSGCTTFCCDSGLCKKVNMCIRFVFGQRFYHVVSYKKLNRKIARIHLRELAFT